MDTGTPSGRDHDSEFERQVSSALAAHGYQTCPQFGVAGFFIDLAVVDPGNPGRYLLGIECDGANYHRSRSARDRDRLRSAVLEDRGWILRRIWSTDWFHRPDEELRKVLAVIEAAKIEWASRADGDNTERTDDSPRVESTEIVRSECTDGDCTSNNGYSSQPYVVAYGLSRDQYAHVLSTFSHTSYGPPFPSEVNTLEDPPIDFRSVKEDEIEIDNLLGVYRLDAHEKSLSTNVMGRLIDLYWHKLDNNTLHQRLRSYQGLREILQSLS